MSKAGAQWVQTGGPKGGYSSIYGVFGSTVIAGIGNDVLYSSDAGASWVVDKVLKSPTTIISAGNVLFAATYASGVLRSYDKGRSWIPANNGLVTNRINALLASGSYLFAGADSGVFRSSNCGNAWERMSNGLPGLYRGAVYALGVKDGFLFAGTFGGVYRSSDNGDHWMPASAGLPQFWQFNSFAVQGSNLYAASYELYLSTDNGGTWVSVKHPGYASWISVIGSYLFTSSSYSQGLYRSSDGGLTWDTLTLGSRMFVAQALKADGSNLYVATSRGLYRSTDLGTSWVALVSEFKSTTVQSLAFIGSNLWAGSEVLYRSSDQGATWVLSYNAPVYDILACRGGMFIRSWDGLLRSTNGGLNWTEGSNEISYSTNICLIDTTLFVGGTYGVYRSTDYGASWTWASPPSAGSIAVSVASVGDVLLATFVVPNAVYRSTDLGDSWSQVFSNYANRIFGADSIMFLVSDRTYRSSDKGITWSPADSGFHVPSAYILGFVAIGKTFFASVSSNGVYRSRDQGLSWTPVNKGLLPANVYSLVSDGTYLYVGTSSQGVWRRSLVELMDATGEQNNGDIPSAYRLDQNYPNPFNSATNIRFTIADDAFVSLKVFDILGRESAILVNEQKVPGTYYATWDATRFSSGVYFCRLRIDFVTNGKAGTYVETKKLVLIK